MFLRAPARVDEGAFFLCVRCDVLLEFSVIHVQMSVSVCTVSRLCNFIFFDDAICSASAVDLACRAYKF